MLERIDNKLPNNMLTTNVNPSCEQENEREIEEMKHAEIGLVKSITPALEIYWNFNTIFELNFKEEGIRGSTNYPKLKELKECFEFTDIDGLKKLTWSSKIFATENFIKTIEGIDKKNKQYQNDYLKPVNMILIHTTIDETCFIIVSLFEAQHLIRLCHEKKTLK